MSPLELLVAAAAIVAGALVKAVTGLGLPIIAIPVMSLFIPVEDAVVIVAIPNLIMNAALLHRVRDAWPQTRDLPVLGVTGVVGAVVGTLVLVSVPEEPLMLALAGLVIAYVATTRYRDDLAVSAAQSRRWAPAVGLCAGVMQGAIGISGPIVATWVYAARLPRDAYVLSVTTIFLVSGAAQAAVLGGAGRLWGTPLVLGLAATVPVLATVPLGASIRDRLASAAFDRLVLLLLTVSAVALVLRVAL